MAFRLINSTNRKIKIIRQTELAECALACLTMIANYHGTELSLAAMRRRFSISMRGTSLKTLVEISGRIGLEARAIHAPIQLVKKLNLPCVVHWNNNHFIVLEKISGRRFYIHNPAERSRWVTYEEFQQYFTGNVVEFSLSPSFAKIYDSRKLKFFHLWHKIKGLKISITYVLITSCIIQALSLISPYYLQIGVDKVIPEKDLPLLTTISVAFCFLAFINVATNLLRNLLIQEFGAKLGYGIAINITKHLFRLRIEWLERRHVGDVISKLQSLGPIRSFLTQGGVATLMDGFMLLTTLILMLKYDMLLTAISVGSLLFYLTIKIFLYQTELRLQEEYLINQGNEQSIFIENLKGLKTLRIANRESERHKVWSEKLYKSIQSGIRVSRVRIWQSAASGVIFGVETVLTIWLAISMIVVSGRFTVGMLFAFMAYKVQFTQRSVSFVDQVISIKMLNLHLSRVSDIALSEIDKNVACTNNKTTVLNGGIELRNISFRYSPSDHLILRNICLKVESGEHIVITGPSGAGKSSLLKIIIGILNPVSGEILFDGAELSELNYNSVRDQISVVLQDDVLFSGSLSDNITFFDANIDYGHLALCSSIAEIHNEIIKMPMKYNTLVGDMGSALSGGQKQKILLARALYRRPKILVIDEGTSHLDRDNERAISASIAKLGITRIVVAHREETIKSAAKVYRIEGGEISLT